jgi:hypothetical protein
MSCPGKNLYEEWSDPLEVVVVEAPVRVPCKRFAIKDNDI